LSAHQVVPLRRSKVLHLLIDALSMGQPVVVCLDTGAAGTVIASESSAKFQIAEMSQQKQIGGLGSSEMIADSAVCRDIELGGFRVEQMSVMITSLAHVHEYLKKVEEEPYDMILGCDFLIGHKAVIDAAGSSLYLHPDYEEAEEIEKMRAMAVPAADVAAMALDVP